MHLFPTLCFLVTISAVSFKVGAMRNGVDTRSVRAQRFIRSSTHGSAGTPEMRVNQGK